MTQPIQVEVMVTASRSRTRDGEVVTLHMKSLVFAEEGSAIEPVRFATSLQIHPVDLRCLLDGNAPECRALLTVVP